MAPVRPPSLISLPDRSPAQARGGRDVKMNAPPVPELFSSLPSTRPFVVGMAVRIVVETRPSVGMERRSFSPSPCTRLRWLCTRLRWLCTRLRWLCTRLRWPCTQLRWCRTPCSRAQLRLSPRQMTKASRGMETNPKSPIPSLKCDHRRAVWAMRSSYSFIVRRARARLPSFEMASPW